MSTQPTQPLAYAIAPADHVDRFPLVRDCAFSSMKMKAMFDFAARNKALAEGAATPPKADKIRDTKPTKDLPVKVLRILLRTLAGQVRL